MQSTDSTLFDMETPLLGRRQFGLARSYGTSATLHCINRAIAGPIMSGQGGSRCCPLLGMVTAVRQTSARGSSRTESVLAPRACGLDHRRRTWPRVYGPVAVHRADRQRRRRVMARTPSPPAAPPATHHGVEAPATRPQTFTKKSACCAIKLIDGFPRFGTHLHGPPPAVPIDPVIESSGAMARSFALPLTEL